MVEFSPNDQVEMFDMVEETRDNLQELSRKVDRLLDGMTMLMNAAGLHQPTEVDDPTDDEVDY